MAKKKNKLNLKKILKQAANLKAIASKDGWRFLYDKDLDHFYFSSKAIASDNLLFSLNDEVSLFIDRGSNINGIFIEYFRTNFVKHQKEYKKLSDILTTKTDGFNTVPEAKKDEAVIFKSALQNEVLSNLVGSESMESKFSVFA